MGDAHADVSKHVRVYMMVFAALVVGTILTVLVARIDFEPTTGVVIALVIATIKGSLVAAIFMHLKWERSASIWVVIVFCAVFFVVLMALPVITANDHPPGVQLGTWDMLPATTVHEGGH